MTSRCSQLWALRGRQRKAKSWAGQAGLFKCSSGLRAVPVCVQCAVRMPFNFRKNCHCATTLSSADCSCPAAPKDLNAMQIQRVQATPTIPFPIFTSHCHSAWIQELSIVTATVPHLRRSRAQSNRCHRSQWQSDTSAVHRRCLLNRICGGTCHHAETHECTFAHSTHSQAAAAMA